MANGTQRFGFTWVRSRAAFALLLALTPYACGDDSNTGAEAAVDGGAALGDASVTDDGATVDAVSAPDSGDASTPGAAELTLLAGGPAPKVGEAAEFLTAPSGVAVDSAGNVYVSDTFQHTIRKVTPAGVQSLVAGQHGVPGAVDGPSNSARFHYPRGLVVDGAGTLYVADSGNHTLRAVSSAGVVSTLAGAAGQAGTANGAPGAARFNAPTGLALASNGDLYVADRDNHAIRRLAGGNVSTFAGTAGTPGNVDDTGVAARFSQPTGLAIDASGTVFVADRNNHTIRSISSGGIVTTFLGSAGQTGTTDSNGTAARLAFPTGVAVDGAGTLTIADSGNHAIRRATSGGVVSTVAGKSYGKGYSDGSINSATFFAPSALALEPGGSFVVADTANHAVRRIAASVSTLVGGVDASEPPSGSTDGTGTAARFGYPSGTVVDSAGNVFVADNNNFTIRKIAPGGVVTTFAGKAGQRGHVDGVGDAARFYGSTAMVIDKSDNLYVADTFTVRRVTPAGAVTTLAGASEQAGTNDGPGTTARFKSLWGIARNSAGLIYVSDFDAHTVRTITPTGDVSTFAGKADQGGHVDATGDVARLNCPAGIAVDGADALYVADDCSQTIRKITPTAAVTTLAGAPDVEGYADGVGAAARFKWPMGLAVDKAGNVYVGEEANHTVRRITPSGEVTTVIGSPSSVGVVLGPLPASLTAPMFLTVTPSGELLISDSDSNRILVTRGFQGEAFPPAWLPNPVDGGTFAARILSIGSDEVGPLDSNKYVNYAIAFEVTESDGALHTIVADSTGLWGDLTGPTCGNLSGSDDFRDSVVVGAPGTYVLAANSAGFCTNYTAAHSAGAGGLDAVVLRDKATSAVVSLAPVKLGLITP